MAKRKKTLTNTGDKDGSRNKQNAELLVRIRDRFNVMVEADEENRRLAQEDFKFLNVPGKQWEDAVRKARGNRPCYEFNKTRTYAKRIINQMRMARPSGKVRAVEDTDKDIASIYEGLIRNVLNVSDFETIQDNAAEYQVSAGYAGWRVETKYSSNDSFNQDVVVNAIRNPFNLYCDPGAKDMLGRDAMDWILTERISKRQFELKYPNKEPIDWESSDLEFDDDTDWDDDESVRICEYWWKEPYTKTLCLLSDGKTIDKADLGQSQLSPDVQVVRERAVRCLKVRMCIVSGDAILEEPRDWACEEFPFVRIYGEWLIVEGKPSWFGIARFAKDAQRSYNTARTAVSELIAQTPQGKWLATSKQAKGLERQWAEAHESNIPFLLYNTDEQAPGPPAWLGGANVPPGLIQELQLSSEELKAVTGLYEANFGARSNETSGAAIRARQAQGDIATFNYQDNMTKGIRRLYEILIALIPKVYDTERVLRIMGPDNAEKYERVNVVKFDPITQARSVINDLSQGQYDVTVTAGPNFATQRQEALEVYTELARAQPQVWSVAGDIITKNMDLPGSEQLSERMKFLLPPQIQQAVNKDVKVPPEVQAMMAQAEQAMAMVQQQGQLVQQAAAEADTNKAAAEKEVAKVQLEISNLEKQRAEFETLVAREMMKLQQREMQLTQQQSDIQVGESQASEAATREQLGAAVQAAVENIQASSNEFIQQASTVLAEIIANKTEPIVVTETPKRKTVRVKREPGGVLIGEVVEDDTMARKVVRVQREPGGMLVGEVTDASEAIN